MWPIRAQKDDWVPTDDQELALFDLLLWDYQLLRASLQSASPAHVPMEADRMREQITKAFNSGEGKLQYGQWVRPNPADADLWAALELEKWANFKAVCEKLVKCNYQQRHYAFNRFRDASIPGTINADSYVPFDPDDTAKALDHGISEQILFDLLYNFKGGNL